MKQPYRVGVDIGGTFTDLILVNSETGEFTIGKTLTTPHDPSEAVGTVLEEALGLAEVPFSQVKQIIHGTTLVTNAMIERKGAKVALFATEGFRDSVEIGRENRYELYDLMLENPRPFVPRYLRFDIPQRTLADGSVHKPLDEDYLRRLTKELSGRGIEAVAICFLHSFSNPADEERARAIVAEAAPHIRVSTSSDVVPEIREFERASTTVANVYVQDLVETYLTELEARLRNMNFSGSFFLMLSSGGVATAETAMRYPVRLLESGPAAGALAANVYARAAGHEDILSFDMGGTTAKICVIDKGQPMLAHEFEVDRMYRFKKGSGLPIKIPVIELIEIGTGGGSVARVDSLGLLKVGPDSAGSVPGPVCYGNGGDEPTVTDANLILGYLDPDYFLGGKMRLDTKGAKRVMKEKIADKLGLSLEEAAWGIHQVANENMANAARVHALERGKDPRRFPLLAFGGAGPMHAYRIAVSLNSPKLIAPLGAGVMSTVGFLSAALSFDFVRSWPVMLSDMNWAQANELLKGMQQEGHDLLMQSGVKARDIRHDRFIDMRYRGQGHEIRVALPEGELDASQKAALTQAFEAAYKDLYERLGPPVGLEILNWRVVSSGPDVSVNLERREQPDGDLSVEERRANAVKGERPAYFSETGGYTSTKIYDRYRLFPGDSLGGPAIIEERESTVIIGPNVSCSIDDHHNLIVDLKDIAGF